jgi:hypothetical protein
MPWLTAGTRLVPSDRPMSTWPLPISGTSCASIWFWKVTLSPASR